MTRIANERKPRKARILFGMGYFYWLGISVIVIAIYCCTGCTTIYDKNGRKIISTSSNVEWTKDSLKVNNSAIIQGYGTAGAKVVGSASVLKVVP